MQPNPPQLETGWKGRLIDDRYAIGESVGQGGMGSVFRAYDQRLSRDVVIKVPRAEVCASPAGRERFLREIRGLVGLEHPHVLRVLDAGERDGVPYVVVQYLDGTNLADQLGVTGCLPIEEVAGWLGPIASALDFIHSEGFVHRDVKPGNLLFDRKGHPYLADFGLLIGIGQEEAQGRLTETGHFVGSPLYAPPEAMVRQFSPAYDQYSLALMVFESLTGLPPFESLSPESILVEKVQGDLPGFSEFGSALEPVIQETLRKGLAFAASDRFPSCSAFAAAVGAAIPGDDMCETALHPMARLDTAPQPPTWRTQVRGHALWIRALLLLLGLAAAYPASRWLSEPGDPQSSPRAFVAGASESLLSRSRDLCRLHPSCHDAALTSEQPRPATLPPFALDSKAVTFRAFERFATNSGYVASAESAGFGWLAGIQAEGRSWRSPGFYEPKPDHPVTQVSFKDAEAFCRTRGARLPTEDEWEYSARGGGAERLFPWGDRWDPSLALGGWHNPDSPESVEARPGGRSPAGHLGMAGNVWEWTITTKDRGNVLKGGSWLEDNPSAVRTTSRLVLPPSRTDIDVGFRCASDLHQWPRGVSP